MLSDRAQNDCDRTLSKQRALRGMPGMVSSLPLGNVSTRTIEFVSITSPEEELLLGEAPLSNKSCGTHFKEARLSLPVIPLDLSAVSGGAGRDSDAGAVGFLECLQSRDLGREGRRYVEDLPVDAIYLDHGQGGRSVRRKGISRSVIIGCERYTKGATLEE